MDVPASFVCMDNCTPVAGFFNTPVHHDTIILLSWASAHGRLQLKHQKLRVGGYMVEVLERLDSPFASAQTGCEVSCQGQPASSLCLYLVEASAMVKKVVLC